MVKVSEWRSGFKTIARHGWRALSVTGMYLKRVLKPDRHSETVCLLSTKNLAFKKVEYQSMRFEPLAFETRFKYIPVTLNG